MSEFLIKVLISAVLVAAVSEMAKRSTLFGALFASIPLVSVLSITWLYYETGDSEQIAAFSRSIFFLVLPSLVLFVLLPVLLKQGWSFWPAMGLSVIATIIAYLLILALTKWAGISI